MHSMHLVDSDYSDPQQWGLAASSEANWIFWGHDGTESLSVAPQKEHPKLELTELRVSDTGT